jgi:hypothetical protein
MHDTRLIQFARSHRVLGAALLLGLLAGCSSSDDDDSPSGSGGATNGASGSVSFGGFATFGGFSQFGGTSSFGGSGSSTFGGSIGSSGSKGGTTLGGATSLGGATNGGGVPSAGVGGNPAATIPPPPGPGGKSPYLAECHGDTRTCVDVVNLTCLGIKDPAVRGYSCSSSCQTNDDCSMAPSGFPATAECVDFAISKHCLFVCLARGEMRACPTGMSCYVYPGAATGYCLWPP